MADQYRVCIIGCGRMGCLYHFYFRPENDELWGRTRIPLFFAQAFSKLVMVGADEPFQRSGVDTEFMLLVPAYGVRVMRSLSASL